MLRLVCYSDCSIVCTVVFYLMQERYHKNESMKNILDCNYNNNNKKNIPSQQCNNKFCVNASFEYIFFPYSTHR